MIIRTARWIFLLIYTNIFQVTISQAIFRFHCPTGCLCVPDNNNLLLITCRWPKIKSFDETFPRNITKTLTIQCIQDEQTNEFQSGMFFGFSKLQELKISNCKMSSLQAAFFDGLLNLHGLHLYSVGSKSLVIDKAFTSSLKMLERMTIANSKLELIEGDALCSMKYLQILNLTENSLNDAGLGVGNSGCILDHLIICDLSFNEITHLDTNHFKTFPSLRQLRLSFNKINNIENDAFEATKLIQHLELDNNYLSEMVLLPDSITHINLANNQLSTIPASVANLLSLVSLNVSGNIIESTTPFSLLSTSIEILDLSNNKLLNIPLKLFRESMNTITTLIMAQNNVTEIQPHFLQNFTRLRELDLSKNQIRSLPYGIFHGLDELNNLQMNDNFIHHVDIEVFNNLDKRLTSLNLANNVLDELPMAVGRLSKIKNINLSGNKIKMMYKFVLNKIHHLTKLDLSDNELEVIESYIFSDSLHLSELILKRNKISSLHDDSFAKCPKLQKIDLAENRIKSWNDSFKQLHSLKVLNISNNNLMVIDWEKLPSHLIELDVSNNAIININKATESTIKILYLRKNHLQTIESEQLPSQLEEIDISNNGLHQISKYSFSGKTQLKRVNVQNNQLKTIPHGIFDDSEVVNNNIPGRLHIAGNPLVCNCEMAWILNAMSKHISIEIADISNSQCILPLTNKMEPIHNVTEDNYLCRYSKSCEPGCICCQFGNCDCKSKCPDNCECFRDSQYKVNIVKCEPTMGKKIAVRELPMFASHIYLTNANLPILRSHDFIGRTRLAQLHIISSGLQIIEPLAFNTLPKLRVLDLSGNQLQKINGDESFKTQRLHKLNIESNRITEIDERLTEIMPNLEVLYAANNDMKTLPKYLTTETARDQLKSITIGNNPFRCDCSSTHRFKMQEWFIPNQGKIMDTRNVFCVENVTDALLTNDSTVLTSFAPNKNDELFTMAITDFLYHENRSLCVVKAEGFFGGTAAQNIMLATLIVVVVIIIITGLFYVLLSALKDKSEKSYGSQTRFKMTNSITSSADHTQSYSPLPSEMTNYFDVFISYSKEDEFTVLEELCRPLEVRYSSVFLLHRDGRFNCNEDWQSISDELNHQVQACQTLIMYITKRFLEKEWKTVQIKMAHYLFAKNTDKKLVAILSEEVDPNELNLELGKILRTKTIIQRKNPLFWRLLESELLSGHPSMGSETSQTYSGTYDCIVPSEIV